MDILEVKYIRLHSAHMGYGSCIVGGVWELEWSYQGLHRCWLLYREVRSLPYQLFMSGHITTRDDRGQDPEYEGLNLSYVGGSQRYRPPKGSGIRPSLRKERKEGAGRYFQLLSGHAPIGSYLAERTRTVSSGTCRRCGSSKRYCWLVQCRAWPPQVRELWRGVGKACG